MSPEESRKILETLKTIVSTLEKHKTIQDDILTAIDTMLDTQQAFLRRIEILELRLDIKEPE